MTVNPDACAATGEKILLQLREWIGECDRACGREFDDTSRGRLRALRRDLNAVLRKHEAHPVRRKTGRPR